METVDAFSVCLEPKKGGELTRILLSDSAVSFQTDDLEEVLELWRDFP